jgi:hypothetical protein
VNEQLSQGSPNQTASTDSKADTLLSPGHRPASHRDSSELNEHHLYDESETKNCDEEPVVKESSEDIDFVSQLTAVDLIENLHENKTLEQDRVDKCLVDLFLRWGTIRDKVCLRWVGQIKNILSSKQNHHEPSNLVD